VRCGAGEFNLRLYFVDAPETNLCSEQTREQSKYFCVTPDEVMKAGDKASDTVREMLREPFVVWTRWAKAPGRGTRYYALVQMGDKSLVEVLVSQGLACAKGVTPNLPTGENGKAYMERLRTLESEARQKRLGIWDRTAENCSETQTR
jgi:endonuclease YncB( thermonuclease family)